MTYRSVYRTAEEAVGYDERLYTPGEKGRAGKHEIWWEAIDNCGVTCYTWQEYVKRGYKLGVANRRFAGMSRGVFINAGDYQRVLREFHKLQAAAGREESKLWLDATEGTIVLPVFVDPERPELGMESGITPGFDKEGKPMSSSGKGGVIMVVILVVIGAIMLLIGRK